MKSAEIEQKFKMMGNTSERSNIESVTMPIDTKETITKDESSTSIHMTHIIGKDYWLV